MFSTYYLEIFSYNENTYRSRDWTIMCGATLDVEVDTVWCLALDLKSSSRGVIEIFVEKL